ncbi:hypothetical protein TCAL_05063 [Tigriopus californicus]|uniref:nicotinamidase n=1 Tax=Tigriopus californicus TaxID=6832 RepID=A0A553P871_TIGCA|nr:hypothetical protein TCAL_05063 [Tigriopus californicus]|eukprot:TCALIF_05063-PA protein Name:"Similar to PNC1 Nicotinamidase (Saccharomyces cerevisiae (strain ATCC 204508 / S288c))" AED:0.15 eAED:0.15 QI:378/0.88/0.9/1/0.88/0.9/10/212/509
MEHKEREEQGVAGPTTTNELSKPVESEEDFLLHLVARDEGTDPGEPVQGDLKQQPNPGNHPTVKLASNTEETSGAEKPKEYISKSMEACFKAFDKDEDNSLNVNEFTALLKALFRNEKGKSYPLDTYMCNDLFSIFNISGDGSMNKEEFVYCWNNWIKKVVRPVSAFIVVDVQNDFIDGSLSISNCPAGQHGVEVIDPINKLLDTVPFDVYCYSLDWHPSDHLSFVDNVKLRQLHETSLIQDPDKASMYDTVVFTGPPLTEQTLWPRHCVQETWGAEFHKDLKVVSNAMVVHKGINPDIDSYSAFYDNKKISHTEMEAHLRSKNVTDIFVCGIAYDVCVESYSSFYDNHKMSETKLKTELLRRGVTDIFIGGLATDVCVALTAFHGLELGFRTMLVDDCSRGIRDDVINNTKDKIKTGHGLIVDSHEVKAMVQGRDRRVELGYFLALQCRKQIIYPLKNKNSRFNKLPAALGQKDGNASNSNAPGSDGQPVENDDNTSNSNHNAVKASA